MHTYVNMQCNPFINNMLFIRCDSYHISLWKHANIIFIRIEYAWNQRFFPRHLILNIPESTDKRLHNGGLLYTFVGSANNRVSSHKSIVDPHAEESYTYCHDTFSASRARDIVIRINQYSELFFTSILSNPINNLCFINTSRKYNFQCFPSSIPFTINWYSHYP